MRNVLKKALCLCLVLCLCLSLGACYSEDNTWIARRGDDVMPIGAYIYYLTSAWSEAGERVSANDKVLKGEIDGQKSTDWMKDRALAYVGSWYFMKDKFDELGLEMTEEDLNAIENGASTWPYYKESMEALGVSENSFRMAYAEQNIRARLVMLAMYGEGGERELSEDEMFAYYDENYNNYEYIYISKSKNDEDGNNVAITDEEREELEATLQEYADQINDGSKTLAEVHTEYSYISMTTPSYETRGVGRKSNDFPAVATAMEEMADNEARVIDMDSGYYLLQKLSLRDAFDETIADSSSRTDLLVEIKGTEFNEYVLEQGAALLSSLEVNQKAANRVRVEDVATDKDQTGASVAPSESSDAEGSSAAAE